MKTWFSGCLSLCIGLLVSSTSSFAQNPELQSPFTNANQVALLETLDDWWATKFMVQSQTAVIGSLQYLGDNTFVLKSNDGTLLAKAKRYINTEKTQVIHVESARGEKLGSIRKDKETYGRQYYTFFDSSENKAFTSVKTENSGTQFVVYDSKWVPITQSIRASSNWSDEGDAWTVHLSQHTPLSLYGSLFLSAFKTREDWKNAFWKTSTVSGLVLTAATLYLTKRLVDSYVYTDVDRVHRLEKNEPLFQDAKRELEKEIGHYTKNETTPNLKHEHLAQHLNYFKEKLNHLKSIQRLENKYGMSFENTSAVEAELKATFHASAETTPQELVGKYREMEAMNVSPSYATRFCQTLGFCSAPVHRYTREQFERATYLFYTWVTGTH